MIRRYLGNYNDFKCIADKCPETCCSGWAIEIDDNSLAKYKAKSRLPEGELLKKNVDYSEACFKQKGNGDCAFLKADGLCKMYQVYGEECLCATCDLYPRHIEEFPGIREYSLSVSCPVVARELLERDDAYNISENSDNELDEDYEDFNDELYDRLHIEREVIISELLNRNVSINDRFINLLNRAKKLQANIDGFDDYDAIAKEDISEEVLKKAYELLFELEPLKKKFVAFVKRVEQNIFDGKLQEHMASFEVSYPKWEIWCEHLVVYFIYTYMCGAVYDDYVYSMMAQAVYNTYMIKMLWIGRGLELGRKLTEDELAEVIYLYSRELEHSNDNMILLEQMLDEFII